MTSYRRLVFFSLASSCLLSFAKGARTFALSAGTAMSTAPSATRPPRTIMVTGANGYLSSYIVRDLLASGHTVHACVRDAEKKETVQHLHSLQGAAERLKLFSTGNLVHAAENHAFDTPMQGCDAVFHTATPLNVKFGTHDGERDIFQPAMTSTKEVLECLHRNAATVQCLVLTSSTAAMAPRPDPAIKDESHWSDAEHQKERENWYGCTKTSQEQLVRDWVRKTKASQELSDEFVYAAICPTMIIGPPLRPPCDVSSVGGTMGSLQKWMKGSKSRAPNDSMSFIHVQDCALMHTAILQLTAKQINAHQRYMSVIESLHWNDILALFMDLYPKLPEYKIYTGKNKVTPTQFDYTNMQSLQVSHTTLRGALKDSIDYLVKIGALD